MEGFQKNTSHPAHVICPGVYSGKIRESPTLSFFRNVRIHREKLMSAWVENALKFCF